MLSTQLVFPDGERLKGDDFTNDADLQPISGYTCIIEYDGDSQRVVSCRKFERIGDLFYVGAISETARSYRQFRCDRIRGVYDVVTGEHLGDGVFFTRFSLDAHRDKVDYWGLQRSQFEHLIAGLNVLAFMAHCDGKWHPLEQEVIEDFACCLWMRKDWEGSPPLDKVTKHAQRLSPDGSVFGTSLRNFGRSTESTTLLSRFVQKVIAADGVITSDEFNWSLQFQQMMAGASSGAAPLKPPLGI